MSQENGLSLSTLEVMLLLDILRVRGVIRYAVAPEQISNELLRIQDVLLRPGKLLRFVPPSPKQAPTPLG